MKNFYQLINLFGFSNISAIQELTEDIKNDFADAYHAIQINKTTRSNAFKKYVSRPNVMKDRAISDVYSDGHTIVSTKENVADIERTAQIADIITGAFSTAQPVDLYLRESAAVARIMGWKPGNTDYYLNVDGTIFCWDLVYSVYSCIADSDKTRLTEYCSLTKFSGRNALIMRGKHGIGLVLPLASDKCPDSMDVNFRHYVDTLNKIDSELVNQALKTA
jgi:hypothetical protein